MQKRKFLYQWATLVAVTMALAFPANAQQPKAPNKTKPQHRASSAIEPNDELIVFLAPNVNPKAFAQQLGMEIRRQLRSFSNGFVLRANSLRSADMARAALLRDPRVMRVYQNAYTHYNKRAFTPNDPLFPASATGGQWHLRNTLTPGLDVNVKGAWDRDITGLGVVVGVVDDGLQRLHPDLVPNYLAAHSFDFTSNDSDPTPISSDGHGTSVGGVAAARGGNALGGTGAAPFAGLAGLRAIASGSTLSDELDAIVFHSNVVPLGIQLKNHSYGPVNPYDDTQTAFDALTVSANAGTIHTWAAGNEREDDASQDATKDLNNTHPDVLVIAALGSDGKFATYSDFGASIIATAPSSSFTDGTFGITTTDLTGGNGDNSVAGGGDGDPLSDLDYTSVFGGTSSAAPLAMGVMALVKQAQPALNARFAKHLIAYTSRIVDATDATPESDGGWKTNKAFLRFNQNYGFGLLDADALTKMAVQFTGVTARTSGSVTQVNNPGIAIPDNDTTGITRTGTITHAAPLETVQVTLNITHTWRGDVEVYLTSPLGTKSRLFKRSDSDSGDNINFTFTTHAFWGERSNGTWKVQVIDTFNGDVGTLNSFTLKTNTGRLIAVPEIASISPNNALAGAAKLTLTVNGSKFTPASRITWNGANLSTSFRSPTQLRATITVAMLATAGVFPVRVVTPNPGGTSAAINFTVNPTVAATNITVSNRTAAPGTIISLSALLRRTSDNTGLASKTIIFKVNGVLAGTKLTAPTGNAAKSFTVPVGLAPGTYEIRAEFAGDVDFGASVGIGTLTVP